MKCVVCKTREAEVHGEAERLGQNVVQLRPMCRPCAVRSLTRHTQENQVREQRKIRKQRKRQGEQRQ